MTALNDTQAPRLWGGGFSAPTAELLARLNNSWAFDRELLTEDVAASIAWVRALEGAGVLSGADAERLRRALAEVGAAGAPAADGGVGRWEDVHGYLEAALYERVGELAGRVHTGRSRNDQVATAFRLYLRSALGEARHLALDLAAALATRAAREAATVMPGYTHLQRAEPITFGHWCLAYVEMLLRDARRLAHAAELADECPLGSGALAGAPIAVDREQLAATLGFARPTANSLDAVAERDAALDYLYAATQLLVHLSRLAEDVIFFASQECGFLFLPDALATGSSRLPQKKNPDLLELTRGHAGRAIGELTGLLAVVKGLPLSYNKDLQLDKEPVFRTRRLLAALLPALGELVAGLRLDAARLRAAAGEGALLAPALADALAARGIPFREAHHEVGEFVAAAMQAGVGLLELGPRGRVTAADLAQLTPQAAVASHQTLGGTAPARVLAAAEAALQRIATLRSRP